MGLVLSTVRTYFSDIAKELGYSKHFDGFATDNIPDSKFSKAFHVEALEFVGSPQNQTIDFTCPVTVRLYFKSYKDVDGGIKVATDAGENYIETALASEKRLTNSTVKNVILDSIAIEPYAASNDNWIVCRMSFTAILFKAIC